MAALDRDILQAIQGHTADRPQDLVGILAWVDVRQKTVLAHDELEGGLRRLIQAGRIAEVAPRHYFQPPAPPAERAFSGVTAAEHRRACAAYHERFWGASESEEEPAPEDDLSRRKIVVHWSIAGDSYPTEEDEEAAEALVEQIERLLAGTGQAEIIGWERGPGAIDILIFGRETDDDVDEIYALIAPAFRQFGCPPESCIVRCYRDRGQEIVSDTVAGGGQEAGTYPDSS